jgi:hypothetical protein
VAYAGIRFKVTLNHIPDLTIRYTRRRTTENVLLGIAYPGYISKGKHPPNSFITIYVPQQIITRKKLSTRHARDKQQTRN